MDKWYHDMFKGDLGKYFLRLSDLRNERLTEKERQFLEGVLKRGFVLDHCCGAGRLSIPTRIGQSISD